MSSDLTRRYTDPRQAITKPSVIRQTNRTLDQIEARSIIRQAVVEAEAEHAAHVIQARNAVTAAAAQADAQLSGLLAALPIQDETDADFRRQLQQATRGQVVANLYRFQP